MVRHKMVIGIIQARMGSKRLPGKSMMSLGNKSMIHRVIERVSASDLVDEFCLATTSNQEDDCLCGVAINCGIKVYRGNENDLVDRIYTCAEWLKTDTIVRICADNPLIEASEIDRIVEHYILYGKDGRLYSNTHNIEGNGYPDGLGAEVYGMKTFKWLHENIDVPELREHPHQFFYDNDLVNTVKCPSEFAYPEIRLDINTKEDYDYIKAIYDKYDNPKVMEYIGGLICQ